MLSYAIRRILQFIPTIIGISLIMFVLLNVLPGNAALMSADKGRSADSNYIETMKKQWGLDKPLHVRYFNYMTNLLQGDLGESFLRGEDVASLIGARIWPTMKLALVAIAIAVVFGIPLGFLSALKHDTWIDTSSMVGAVSGVSVPHFWLGLILMYILSIKFNLLPTFGYGDGGFSYMIMPSITLGVGYMALLARTTRAAALEVLSQDYIRTARSKGLSRLWINRKHIFRNTLVLIMTTAGLQFGSLLGNTVVVEKLFSWPGIGSLMVDSIFQRDVSVTQGCILLIVSVFLVLNLTIDLLYSIVDPRIQYE